MQFPEFNPVWFSIGPLDIRWYALAYVAGIVLGWWYAARIIKTERLWAPGKLPEAISKRLTEEAAKAMRSSLVADRLGAQGFVASPMGPAQFAPYITKEIATYARIVRDAKIQID